MPVSLWVLSEDVDCASVMKQIRDSDYVQELVSGEEGSVEKSILELVQAVPWNEGLPTNLKEIQAYVQHQDNPWSPRVVVVADERTAKNDGTLMVVETQSNDSLRVVPGSLLEVSKLHAQNK
ncbi:hypothetical protein MYAM1_002548 [Malassezia yamatoensis]|uniref:Uncharacterized protein n=1 Tax=Malassezia yamatoensis TaxID=253288 RepID=A0AAJ5YV07_9BASI|nr:hypothetical protein MYAM1_002548 [Malassezia yamatoensis]